MQSPPGSPPGGRFGNKTGDGAGDNSSLGSGKSPTGKDAASGQSNSSSGFMTNPFAHSSATCKHGGIHTSTSPFSFSAPPPQQTSSLPLANASPGGFFFGAPSTQQTQPQGTLAPSTSGGFFFNPPTSSNNNLTPSFAFGTPSPAFVPSTPAQVEDEEVAEDKHEALDTQLFETLLKSPTYQAWIEQIQQRDPRPLKFITKETDENDSRAHYNVHANEIALQDFLAGDPNRRMSYMAFETTNALQQARQDQLDARAAAGTIDKEDYAREAERIEYEGLVMHHELMLEGIEKYGWDPSVDRFGKFLASGGKWESFEAYFATQSKGTSSHTNIHRSNYDKIRERAEKKS
ncbi:MAG: hypothetical protein HOW73_14855 [Polyangiaceae bacterium]|nr:hypothetical protein [Polyangiaceae bacterium]